MNVSIKVVLGADRIKIWNEGVLSVRCTVLSVQYKMYGIRCKVQSRLTSGLSTHDTRRNKVRYPQRFGYIAVG